MIRVAVRGVLARWTRSLAVVAAVLATTGSFGVLAAAVRTSQLQAKATADANSRASYDILVRPRDSRDPQERTLGLVRPNYLNSQYGGITVGQWQDILHIPGVQTAAPVAVVGYVAATAQAWIPLDGQVDSGRVRQAIRLRPTWQADAGLSTATEPQARYVYVTRRPVAVAHLTPDLDWQSPDGAVQTVAHLTAIGCGTVPYPLFEQSEDGTWIPLCGTWYLRYETPSASGQAAVGQLNQAEFDVYQALPDGTYLDFTHTRESALEQFGERTQPRATPNVSYDFSWPLWLPMAAIDPEQESRLVGLDRAVLGGGYLTEHPDASDGTLPVLVSARSSVQESLLVRADTVDGRRIPGTAPGLLTSLLDAEDGTNPHTLTYQSSDAYNDVLRHPDGAIGLNVSIRTGAPTYVTGPDGALHTVSVAVDARAWSSGLSQFGETRTGAQALQPYLSNDTSFRPVLPATASRSADVTQPAVARVVGVYDPQRIDSFSQLAAVPMETYAASTVTGADSRTRTLLAGGILPPSDNPAGYVAAPPSLLTSIDAFAHSSGQTAFISAVRVRVAGVQGVDPRSRERVRTAAEAILKATGLDVDITLGSSPQNRAVVIPAGRFGRPDLLVNEGWSKKGVALAIVRAADRKSVVLFALLLVVCVLSIGNSVGVSTEARRQDFGVLASLGWNGADIARLLLTESGLLAVSGGVLGALLTWPGTALLGLRRSWPTSVGAAAAGIALALLAAALPALRAVRRPGTSPYRPVRHSPESKRRKRSLGSYRLALANLTRTPARTSLACASLAVGVGSTVLVSAVLRDFGGTVGGTLLGDAVALRVRGFDVVAVLMTIALGLFTFADTLFVSTRHRASEFGTLLAIGWSDSELGRLVATEGLILGVAGSLVGGLGGLALVGWLAPTAVPGLLGLTGTVVFLGVLASMLAGTAPAALLIRTVSTSALQAEE